MRRKRKRIKSSIAKRAEMMVKNFYRGIKIGIVIAFLSLILIESTTVLEKKMAISDITEEDVSYEAMNMTTGYFKIKDGGKKLITSFINILTSINLNNYNSIFNDGFTAYYLYDNDIFVNGEEDIYNPSIDADLPEDPYPTNIYKEPIVYIYNTHQREEYQKDPNDGHSVIPTVVTMSYILKAELSSRGIPSVVENNDFHTLVETNGMDYDDLYTISRMHIQDAMTDYPTVEYLIDLHRDSPNRDKTTIEIDGKSYAQILFVVQLEIPTSYDNIILANILKDKINDKYPDLCKGIFARPSYSENEKMFNQDILGGSSILIEIGGYQNTFEEASRSVSVFAEVLAEHIRDQYTRERRQ